MFANSSEVESAQTGPHPRLEQTVARHLATDFKRPLSANGISTFAVIQEWLSAEPGRPLILDSGCGTGWSTQALAERNPDARVLGTDRSEVRLERSGLRMSQTVHCAGAICLARINLEDLWPQLVTAGVRLHQHKIWYPNPSPKPEHLKRRWHAHPTFPTLLALRGTLELRSNWKLYLDEFAVALRLAGQQPHLARIPADEAPVTPFEKKYRASGHSLWQLRSDLTL